MQIEHNRDRNNTHAKSTVFDVMGVPIAATSIQNTIEILSSWLRTGNTTRLVTFTNVHMLTEASRKPHFLKLLREMADLLNKIADALCTGPELGNDGKHRSGDGA